jgi:hypothetical protein
MALANFNDKETSDDTESTISRRTRRKSQFFEDAVKMYSVSNKTKKEKVWHLIDDVDIGDV